MADTVLFAISFAPDVSFVNVLLKDLPNIRNYEKEWGENPVLQRNTRIMGFPFVFLRILFVFSSLLSMSHLKTKNKPQGYTREIQ